MRLSEFLMIVAVLLAPVVAVQVQKYSELYREKRERKLKIFKTLMATRATGLSVDHVQALNMIDLEFEGRKFKSVKSSWRKYLDHLGNFPKQDEKSQPVWSDKKADLLAELLLEMGKSLKYEFDHVHIKKGIYLPEGHAQINEEQSLLRRGMLDLVYGDRGLKMDVNSFPVDEEALEIQKELNKKLVSLFDGKAEIPINIKK